MREHEVVTPQEVGLSGRGLTRLQEILTREVEADRIPGAVALVARRGRIALFKAIGYCARGSGAPMRLDSIFRVYSMTKPFTSVAALLLMEEGRLALHERVGEYLPQLKAMQVIGDSTDPATGRAASLTVPARGEITVRDLLLHTSGLGGGVHSSARISHLYRDAGIVPYEHTEDATTRSSQWLVDELSRLPLANEPGTVWEYGRSGDVLGRLLEVVSGQPLDRFLEERLFRPLGMHDTGFYVPTAEHHRLARPDEPPAGSKPLVDLANPPLFVSGGSGAYSTAPDYYRFLRMLVGGGQLDGVRVLSRKTVEWMTADHLGPLAGSGPDYIPGEGYGFGLGVAVRQAADRATFPCSTGDYWWLGRASTSFLVGGREDLVAIMMAQRYARARHYQALFRTLVYQALED